MGCDIHMITEIKDGNTGKWERVPEIPKAMNERNYGLFAFLADVRNSFSTKGFSPKGLPDDISGMLFDFQSDAEYHAQQYETGHETYLLTADGKYHREYDSSDDTTAKSLISISEAAYHDLDSTSDWKTGDRYRGLGWSMNGDKKTWYVHDAYSVGGKWVEVYNNVIFKTLAEYEKAIYQDDWNEDAQDYGYWKIDFQSEDYHSHSYLTLHELKAADKTDYAAVKYKLDRQFFLKFKECGGVLPACFSVQEEHESDSIADVIREAFAPTVLVSWQPSSNIGENMALMKGIRELETIAKQYNKTDDEIRIVFAFDN